MNIGDPQFDANVQRVIDEYQKHSLEGETAQAKTIVNEIDQLVKDLVVRGGALGALPPEVRETARTAVARSNHINEYKNAVIERLQRDAPNLPTSLINKINNEANARTNFLKEEELRRRGVTSPVTIEGREEEYLPPRRNRPPATPTGLPPNVGGERSTGGRRRSGSF